MIRVLDAASGSPAALNRAAARARAELLAFRRRGDGHYPSFAERMARAFARPGVAAAVCNADKVDARGRLIERRAAPRQGRALDWFRRRTGLSFQPGLSMIVIRRRAFRALGGFDETFRDACAEIDLLFRIGERYGPRAIIFVDEALVAYRVAPHLALSKAFSDGRPIAADWLPESEKPAALDLAYFGLKHGLFRRPRP